MKLCLDSVCHTGYFVQGEPGTLESVIEKAAAWGYDAVDVFPHRPMAFPMDVSEDRRKRLVELAQSKDIEFAAIEACTNFMMSDHILTNFQDKELLFVRECCKLAQDLGAPIVRILAGFVGYFFHEHWSLGYSNTAMHGRNIDVSTEEDFLRQWEFVRAGIKEACKIGQDFGVQIALQNHPPITNNTQDTLDMVEEVDEPNLGIGLDLPLFHDQSDAFVRETVLKVGTKMIHTHALGFIFNTSLAGVHGFDEVVPGEGRENWPAFLQACKEIGFDGCLAYEQCSPIHLKGHKRATMEEIDRRCRQTTNYLKPLLLEMGLYTGHKEFTPIPVDGKEVAAVAMA